MAVLERLRSSWNAFRTPTVDPPSEYSPGAYYGGSRPDRTYLRSSNERSIIASIFTRISIDVAALDIRHVSLDEKGRYTDDIDSGFNRCLTFEPNLDQGPRAFRQDIALTMMDSDQAAVVPIDALRDSSGGIEDILTMRVGRVVKWWPRNVTVSVYNPETMVRQEVTVPKTEVALPDNPLANVMNGPNSTLNRLIRKLNLLDIVDEKVSSNKLDLIIQLPYTVRGDVKKAQVDQRRDEIEQQLTQGAHGIAWADATEKIVQLNRPVENNMLGQIEWLTKQLLSQLGLTAAVMDGTASEQEMLTYQNRTVEPIAQSIIESLMRSFVGLDGLQRGERVRYYKNPFLLVPVGQFADIADKFTRNEILTANEIRGYMGIEPHDDPKADQLLNSNINPSGMTVGPDGSVLPKPSAPGEDTQSATNGALDEVAAAIEDTFKDLGA